VLVDAEGDDRDAVTVVMCHCVWVHKHDKHDLNTGMRVPLLY
jgi:hypothetical protein